MTPASTPDVPPGYWHDTEQQLALANARDRAAALDTNDHFTPLNHTPFGHTPEPVPTALEATA